MSVHDHPDTGGALPEFKMSEEAAVAYRAGVDFGKEIDYSSIHVKLTNEADINRVWDQLMCLPKKKQAAAFIEASRHIYNAGLSMGRENSQAEAFEKIRLAAEEAARFREEAKKATEAQIDLENKVAELEEQVRAYQLTGADALLNYPYKDARAGVTLSDTEIEYVTTGEFISAVKEYRNRTGRSLMEAKSDIESWLHVNKFGRHGLTLEEERLVHCREVIRAIKEVRVRTGWGLIQAKKLVDNYRIKAGV